MSSVRLLPCFLWLFGLCTYFYRCAEIDGSPRRASWRLGRGCNASFKCQRTNWLVTQVLPNSYKKKNKQKAQSLKLELHSSSKAPQHPPKKKSCLVKHSWLIVWRVTWWGRPQSLQSPGVRPPLLGYLWVLLYPKCVSQGGWGWRRRQTSDYIPDQVYKGTVCKFQEVVVTSEGFCCCTNKRERVMTLGSGEHPMGLVAWPWG
jgi:hypothetical protein